MGTGEKGGKGKERNKGKRVKGKGKIEKGKNYKEVKKRTWEKG